MRKTVNPPPLFSEKRKGIDGKKELNKRTSHVLWLWAPKCDREEGGGGNPLPVQGRYFKPRGAQYNRKKKTGYSP